MYIRTITRKNKNETVQYVQLAHNYRHPRTGQPQAKILFNFGRIDKLDVEALKRLAASITKFLKQNVRHAAAASHAEDHRFEFLGAKRLGSIWFLDELWQKLAINNIIQKNCQKKENKFLLERLIFAIVTLYCLAPNATNTLKQWAENEVFINGLPKVELKLLDQALDFMHETGSDFLKQIFASLVRNLKLPTDQIFLRTTTTCPEIKATSLPVTAGINTNHATIAQSTQKAHTVIAFACTSNGIPVYCRLWPETTDTKAVLAAAKKELECWGVKATIIGIEAKEIKDLSQKQIAAIKLSLCRLKEIIACSPLYPSLKEQSKAHILFCWLGLLLIRVAEQESGQNWLQIKRQLENLQLGHHKSREGEFGLTSPLSPAQVALFKKLSLDPPPRRFQF